MICLPCPQLFFPMDSNYLVFFFAHLNKMTLPWRRHMELITMRRLVVVVFFVGCVSAFQARPTTTSILPQPANTFGHTRRTVNPLQAFLRQHDDTRMKNRGDFFPRLQSFLPLHGDCSCYSGSTTSIRRRRSSNTQLRRASNDDNDGKNSLATEPTNGMFLEGSILDSVGLLSQPIVWISLVFVATTGAGLPAGPGGLLGAIEGISYLLVVGLAGSALLVKENKIKSQQVSLVTLGLALVVLLKLIADQGCIPNAKPILDYSDYLRVCDPIQTPGFFGGIEN